MRVVGVLFVGAVVACSTHEAMKTPDAALVTPMPDACPPPTFYGECLPNGFLQINPDGTWNASGTTTSQIEMGSATTTGFTGQFTIHRSNCAADVSNYYPNARKYADDSVIEFRCDPGLCFRTTSQMHICVRATDNALIYVDNESHTSTMPGNYYSSAMTTAVLTPVQ